MIQFKENHSGDFIYAEILMHRCWKNERKIKTATALKNVCQSSTCALQFIPHHTAKCLSDTERWHFWMQYFSHAHMLLVMLGQQYQCKTAKQCNVSYVITDIISDICRAFSLAGPAAWNSLPDYLQDPSRSFNSFRQDLKTFPVSFY